MWRDVAIVCLSGLIGVLGVSLGARLQNRAIERREAERRRTDRLVAARLVLEELRTAVGAFDYAWTQSRWWGPESISTAWWDKHAGALAGLLAEAEWDILVRAYHAIETGETTRTRRVPAAECLQEIQLGQAQIKAAILMLERHTRGVGNETLDPGEGAVLAAMSMLGQPAVPEHPDLLEELERERNAARDQGDR